jgi:hypothetical protein
MPKTEDKELFDTLRATGLRKKVARSVSAISAGANDKESSAIRKTAERLRSAAAALEHRVDRPPATTRPAKPARTRPAKKAANTPTRRANRRVATPTKRATKSTRS